jgi:hypothetical protein
MMTFRSLLPGAFAVFVSSGLCAPVSATTVWPNLSGVGPCTSTLQECVTTAAPGETVLIGSDDLLLPDGSTVIDENIVIGKSITLAAAPGVDAVFAPGRWISVISQSSGAVAVNLQRLTLRDGHIAVLHNSSDAGVYTLSAIVIEDTDVSPGACAVQFEQAAPGSAQFILGDSRLAFARSYTGPAPNGVCALGDGGGWQVSYFRNRLNAKDGALGRGLSVGGTSSGSIILDGNQISGDGYVGGIKVSLNPGSGANTLYVQNNSIMGQRLINTGASEYAISLGLTNTTFRAVNNTVVHNTRGIIVGPLEGNATSGRIANNLIAFNQIEGLAVDSRLAATISNDYNLVFANANNDVVLGAHTVTADPQLIASFNPRLLASSPAHEGGNNADAPASAFGPTYDADGELRQVGNVDIGAFEGNGDYAVAHASTAANVDGDTTYLDSLAGLLSTSERLLVTPWSGDDTIETAANIGVYETALSASNWAIYREDVGALSSGRRFSVLAPFDGRTNYIHTTMVANDVEEYTTLDAPELNGKPDALVYVTHNWNPGGVGGTYFDHAVGVYYQSGHWYVRNQDLATMPAGIDFNIVVASPGSTNAFRATLDAVAAPALRLEHPQLDDNPCAALLVTRNAATSADVNNVAYGLRYVDGVGGASGHWWIVAEGAGGPSFPGGSGFNVMVQGAQAGVCRDDRIFANGFDAP